MSDILENYLLDRGRVSTADLDRARLLQDQTGAGMQQVLLRLGVISEQHLAEAVSEVLELPIAAAEDYPVEPLFEGALSAAFLRQAEVIPLRTENHELLVSMVDPEDNFVREALQFATGLKVRRLLGLRSDIEAAFKRLYGGEEITEADLEEERAADSHPEDIEHLRDLASEAPVIRMVNTMLTRALDAGASDIHIEPFEDQLKVRYRVDGVLQEVESPPAGMGAAVISRVKILSRLNIAERRLPQDGRIQLRLQGRSVDFRVSTVPTLHGESVVMRILDRTAVALDLETLGFGGAVIKGLRRAIAYPYGIVLVTGPTGSGKTTTLYAALRELNTPERKILTVEDPIEYQLEGINQLQVNSKIELSFARALRAFLRQDPDVILIGEMRDRETASIAIQAALTGHLVLSTLHTNDAASAVTRLLDMGMEDYLITSTVRGILAQRLVRTLCPECKTSYTPGDELCAELGVTGGEP
ncbi:MAG: ATPase, T2SS/T4P/T4SS family, partial [Pseudomonadota bacterium]